MIENIKSLKIRKITEEDGDMDNLEHILVEVYDENKYYEQLEINPLDEPKPLAKLFISKILGEGSQEYIIDTADSQSENLLLAAARTFKHDDHNVQDYFTALFKLESIPFEYVDQFMYLDKIILSEDINHKEMAIIINAAVKSITKGLDIDSWIFTTHSKSTAFIIDDHEEKNDFDNEEKTKFSKSLKYGGFRTISKEDGLLGISHNTLKLNITNKNESSLKNKM